ncbi:Endo-1,4-beta-xylanase A precursor [compost metagenome]
MIGKLKLRIVQTGDTKVTLKQVVLLDSSLHKKMIENAGEVKLSADSETTTQPTPQPTSKPSTQPTTPPSASPSVPNNNPTLRIVPSDKAATYFRLAEIQSDLPGKLTPVGQLYDISWTGDKAKVSLAVGSIGNLDITKLGVYRFDLLANKWIYEGGKLNKTQTELTFMADQPGLYVLMVYNRTFTDISEHWAREVIEVMAARHIAQGITVDKFEPDGLVTRAGFAAFLLRALDLSSTRETGRTFEDVDKDSWFAPVVAAAVDFGILNGDTAHIRPNDPVTREEMVVMLMRAYMKTADRKLDSLGTDELPQVTFNDAADISDWSLESLQAARALGIIEGAGENRILPKHHATRAESLTVIKRMLDLLL